MREYIHLYICFFLALGHIKHLFMYYYSNIFIILVFII